MKVDHQVMSTNQKNLFEFSCLLRYGRFYRALLCAHWAKKVVFYPFINNTTFVLNKNKLGLQDLPSGGTQGLF